MLGSWWKDSQIYSILELSAGADWQQTIKLRSEVQQCFQVIDIRDQSQEYV